MAPVTTGRQQWGRLAAPRAGRAILGRRGTRRARAASRRARLAGWRARARLCWRSRSICALHACTQHPPLARRPLRPRSAASSGNGAAATANGATATPVVKIDNRTDPFATIVSVEFGDRLGELLDTVSS